MLNHKKFWPIIAILLGGCAVSGEVVNVNASESKFEKAVYPGVTRILIDDPDEFERFEKMEQYRVFEQSYSGYGSIPEARDQAEPRAKEFCRAKGKKMKTIKEITSTPPHILGNWPRIEMVFVCLPIK